MMVSMSATAPTVLWRLFHPEGRHARAVFLPGTPKLTLTFFVDNQSWTASRISIPWSSRCFARKI